MKRTALLVGAVVTPMLVPAQTTRRPEILVLCTYHMASPGRDLYNTKVDDVMAATRQMEIARMVNVLKRFAATKIAVEANVSSGRVKREYSRYLEGNYALTPNEIAQLGYRLAKGLDYKTVYAVLKTATSPSTGSATLRLPMERRISSKRFSLDPGRASGRRKSSSQRTAYSTCSYC